MKRYIIHSELKGCVGTEQQAVWKVLHVVLVFNIQNTLWNSCYHIDQLITCYCFYHRGKNNFAGEEKGENFVKEYGYIPDNELNLLP